MRGYSDAKVPLKPNTMQQLHEVKVCSDFASFIIPVFMITITCGS